MSRKLFFVLAGITGLALAAGGTAAAAEAPAQSL
jgi:hypothetical protein